MNPVRFSYDADEGWVACRDLSNPDEPRGYGWTRPLAVAALTPAARDAQARIWAIECKSRLTDADYAEIRRLRQIK